jgi:hypothetical protein
VRGEEGGGIGWAGLGPSRSATTHEHGTSAIHTQPCQSAEATREEQPRSRQCCAAHTHTHTHNRAHRLGLPRREGGQAVRHGCQSSTVMEALPFVWSTSSSWRRRETRARARSAGTGQKQHSCPPQAGHGSSCGDKSPHSVLARPWWPLLLYESGGLTRHRATRLSQ